MRPKIDATWFGSITIEGQRYEYDVVIGLKGKVHRRNKHLSKAEYGTSHTLSLDEVKEMHRDRAEKLIIGTGQEGQVHLSSEAAAYLKRKGCAVELYPTPEALVRWNDAEGLVLGLFHVTC